MVYLIRLVNSSTPQFAAVYSFTESWNQEKKKKKLDDYDVIRYN
jgi:hypothetical protein